MNGSAIQFDTLPKYGRSRIRVDSVRREQTHAAEAREERYFNPLTALGSMLAAVIFTITSLVAAAVAVAAIVFLVPWLLVAPMILAGLVISLAGFVLSGFGLV